MRAWRPAHKCIYVIPEIHGNIRNLEIILNRILPMRFSAGQEDILIFLGDYIDGHSQGAEVISALINIKKEYGDRSVILRGNHEQLMLRAINGSNTDFDMWISQGGRTTIASYLEMNNMKTSPFDIAQNRLSDIVPKKHIEFISDMPPIHHHDNYLFFHGSFDNKKTINENNEVNFMFDHTASKYLKQCVKNKSLVEFKDNYVFIGSHNTGNKKPYVHPKYLMLGGGAPDELYVFELNSLTASVVGKNKSQMRKFSFKVVE